MKSITFEDQLMVPASAQTVFALLERIEEWPKLFGHVNEVHVLERVGNTERLELVVESRRKTFRERTERTIMYPCITFRRQHRWLKEWNGYWRVEETGVNQACLTLCHQYRVPFAPVDWVARVFIRNNSRRILSELHSICSQRKEGRE